jgi:DNA-binding SARP family transcriptional activator
VINEPVRAQVRLLGPVDIVLDGVEQRISGLRRRALLAVLALHHGQVVSTDQLIDIVWGDAAGSVSTNTLQRHISYLRALLGDPGAVVAQPPGYRLDLPAEAIDAALAEQLIESATRAGTPAERGRLAEQARGLWQGEPLGGVAGIAWLEEHAQRLSDLRLRATHTLIDARLALGEHARVLPELELLAGRHALDERLQGQLIRALYRNGRQADALDAYHRLRRTLADEMGIEPGPELRDLATAILRQDSELDPPVPTTAGPKPTLAGPGPADGRVRLAGTPVVGRHDELTTVRDAVDSAARGRGGVVIAIGEPGIGKTRLAAETAQLAERAGLTVLRGRAGTLQAQFRPLTEALQSVLRHDGVPDHPDLLPYRPALARLIPQWRAEAPAAPENSLVVLAEAVLRLLATLGRPHGCLLVLEDLHDADADTLAVVDYLIDNAGRERLLVLGTCRDTPGPALHLLRAAQQRRAATVVELRRLDGGQVLDLAASCLGVPAEAVPAPVAERLWATADGVPLHIEELLAAMVADGVLAWTGAGWTVAAPMPAGVPASLQLTLVGRTDRLGPAAAGLLQVAAMFGRRFPAVAAGAAAGLHDMDLLAALRSAVDSQLLVPDYDPQWYAFRHVLTAESLFARPLPLERAVLARRAAEALGDPAVPRFDGAHQLAGTLWRMAGEPVTAAGQFRLASRQAIAQGAVSTAVTLLEQAWTLDAGLELREALVNAYALAGRVADAYALGENFEAAPPWQARIQLQLATVAVAAGDWARGAHALGVARRSAVGTDDPVLAARMDAVEAELVFGDPGTPDRSATTVVLAERALRGAEAAGLPEVACSALKTLGRCARLRDLAEADDLYERGLAVATEHQLVTWRISMLFNLGADAGMRDADDSLLLAALAFAGQAGAVTTALTIELELSILRACRGEFEAAEAGARHCEEVAARLRLTLTQRIAVCVRVIVAGHRGRRSDVAVLMARLADLGGEDDDCYSGARGLGVAFGHLLHEEPDAALAELDAAGEYEARRPTPYLSLMQGPHLLMAVRGGRAGAAECAAFAGSPQNQAAWNRQFLLLAEALVAGRAGRPADAEEAMARYAEVSAPYPLAHHLGLRLVAPDALDQHWGDPVSWLRAADAYFHDAAPPVSRACRTLLLRAGAPVPQYRPEHAAPPSHPAARLTN